MHFDLNARVRRAHLIVFLAAALGIAACSSGNGGTTAKDAGSGGTTSMGGHTGVGGSGGGMGTGGAHPDAATTDVPASDAPGTDGPKSDATLPCIVDGGDASGDCCPDDPLKTQPGVCGCGLPLRKQSIVTRGERLGSLSSRLSLIAKHCSFARA